MSGKKGEKMSRWIDADYLKQNINTPFWSEVGKIIDNAPSIDIVRCKECRKTMTDGNDYICHHLSGLVGLNVVVKPDDFCSYGERRATDE